MNPPKSNASPHLLVPIGLVVAGRGRVEGRVQLAHDRTGGRPVRARTSGRGSPGRGQRCPPADPRGVSPSGSSPAPASPRRLTRTGTPAARRTAGAGGRRTEDLGSRRRRHPAGPNQTGRQVVVPELFGSLPPPAHDRLELALDVRPVVGEPVVEAGSADEEQVGLERPARFPLSAGTGRTPRRHRRRSVSTPEAIKVGKNAKIPLISAI